MSPPLAAFVVGAYLLGAVPFGLLLARAFGKVDVRESGSGNIGATNVARVAGKKLGVLTLLLDALKGLAPVLLALWLAPRWSGEPTVWAAASGFAAFIGHCYPVYLKLRGGKGVATALGVFLGVAPVAALSGFVAYAVVYAVFRISSIGSLLAAVVVPTVVYWTVDRTYFWLALAVVAVIVWKHRGNIQRIAERTESRL